MDAAAALRTSGGVGLQNVPDLPEILTTADRLEWKLRASADQDIALLLASYDRLCARFEEDLSDARDRALSRAAALMLIRYHAELS